MADLFSLRETEIFDALKKLNTHFILIGGYAVNAYALPRFSIDCDIVIESIKDLAAIEKTLFGLGYTRSESTADIPYHANFVRYEKNIQSGFRVSVDVLIGKVTDRLSGASFPFEWIAKNSALQRLRGKTTILAIDLLIPDAEALFAMKFASCRETDIRDMFMLVSHVDLKKLKGMISDKSYFATNLRKLKTVVGSKQFRNNLAGVYGHLDEKTYGRYQKSVLGLFD